MLGMASKRTKPRCFSSSLPSCMGAGELAAPSAITEHLGSGAPTNQPLSRPQRPTPLRNAKLHKRQRLPNEPHGPKQDRSRRSASHRSAKAPRRLRRYSAPDMQHSHAANKPVMTRTLEPSLKRQGGVVGNDSIQMSGIFYKSLAPVARHILCAGWEWGRIHVGGE
jgi:hypothetical protein